MPDRRTAAHHERVVRSPEPRNANGAVANWDSAAMVQAASSPASSGWCRRGFPLRGWWQYAVLGVSVEGEDAAVVAGVVAAGAGDVGEAVLPGGADDEVADGGGVGGLVAGACLLGVLAEGDVADVVLAVVG